MSLTSKQWEALSILTKGTPAGDRIQYLLYGGAGGGGKSWLGCVWLAMVCSNYAGVRYFVGRNNLKDTRESVIVTFQKVMNEYGVGGFKFTDYGVKFENTSEIVFLDLSYYPKKDPMFERYGSKEFTGGWIEEAGEVHALAFEVLKSRIGRHLNDKYNIPPQILITCNPKKNWLYTQFYKCWKDGSLKPPYHFIQALVEDNRYIGKEYIESLENITDRVTRERLRLGMWEYDDNPNALVDYEAITDLFTNDHCANVGKTYISADVALMGRDSYVRALRKGDTIYLTIKPQMHPDEVVNDIRQSAMQHAVPKSSIVVDSDGVGAYVPTYIGGAVFEFHGESRSFTGNYNNLKSECGYKLAELINRRMLHVVTADADVQQRLSEELSVLMAADIDNDTKKKSIITKDKQKQIIGHSPDILDALIMLMVFEVKGKNSGIQNVGV